MFTGLVEEIGRLRRIELAAGGARLEVEGPLVVADARAGDSIAVNGVCLTVTACDAGAFTADAMAETLNRTALGALAPGAAVNLERALPANGRLGGHIVQGHVDAVGRLLARVPGAAWETLSFAVPPAIARYIALKGSIAVDGVSLTVTAAEEAGVAVGLIPATLAGTALGALAPGAPVNIEVDVLAKYVERLLAAAPPAPANHTETDTDTEGA
jgi:riboflavin synthase